MSLESKRIEAWKKMELAKSKSEIEYWLEQVQLYDNMLYCQHQKEKDAKKKDEK